MLEEIFYILDFNMLNMEGIEIESKIIDKII